VRPDPNNQLLSAICEVYDLRLSQVAQADPALDARNALQRASARRIIFREHDLHDDVPVICDGRAASVAMLSDGRRQILSFLLPGDMVSTVLLFDPWPNCVIEAITDVQYRMFKRADLKDAMLKHAYLFEQISKAWIEEKHRADQLIVDLGRRTADERIARLILNLWERLAERGVMTKKEPMEMEFPLRQHHVADGTGLTAVHVSVLSEFRRNGLVKISDRSLAILDPTGFRRVAHMR
jgi:CRP/FNR family transcriptional regulator, anaerobic regulatory protein